MKENSIKNERSSIEEDIILLKDFIEGNFKRDKLENYKGSYKMGYFYYKDIQQALEHILSDYKRVLKENEELKKSKITYEAVRDIQEKNRNIVDNNYISKQIVKDNLIKYQEEYELLLEHQSGKESNKAKTLRGRIHMCQELLEGRK